MAEHAHRSAGAKKPKRQALGRTVQDRAAKAALAAAAVPGPDRKKRPAAKANAANPNAASPFFQHLSALADKADRGESIDTAAMSDEEFLAVFLGR